MRRWGVVAGAVAAVVIAVCGRAQADPVPPEQDSFYAVPGDVGAYAPGTVLRSRPSTVTFANLPLPVTARQLLYATTDSHDAPTATVATVLAPATPWPGPGPRPLLSFQVAEDGVATSCAPSYALGAGLAAGLGSAHSDVVSMAATALTRGWAVVTPDFEGPQSEFLAGPMAGHGVLDGIRAALAGGTDGLTPRSPVALTGYSGGAFASLWAAELQPTYAPDLPLVGAAVGGMPADLTAVPRDVDGGPFSGFLVGALIGLDRAYPEAGLRTLLSAHGAAVIASGDNDCVVQMLARYPFLHSTELSSTPDPLGTARAVRLFRRNSLGHATPGIPILEYHALGDEVTDVAQADAQLDRYCAAGVAVDRIREPGEHLSGAMTAMPWIGAYLADRIAGNPAPTNCGTT
ncbi:lipase family protein [Nocardia terpenica]|uniref:lipase family protein n=1 Tax=Nocardia terpenica TaxID=455432 RepID=UPI0008301FBC|nr:lipase family protein [Nocardia terpenica]NQE86379.1 lipase [Nocardia terpenica]